MAGTIRTMYEFYMLQMQVEFIDHEENYGDRV